jgi:hypothetical protein
LLFQCNSKQPRVFASDYSLFTVLRGKKYSTSIEAIKSIFIVRLLNEVKIIIYRF